MIDVDLLLSTLASGLLIGFALGLVGGGGSILAVPLLVHFVGASSPHVAIGTAAVAVGLNAITGLAQHARAGTVKWRCGLAFAGFGVAGALAGAELGKAFDGQRLLFLFGLLMIGVGATMMVERQSGSRPDVRLTRENARQMAPRLLPAGFGVGLLSGFFGIGGGFLIVPALVAATAMPLANAMATSLVAVSAFGLSTAASYALSGLIDWQLVLLLIAGGAIGSMLGVRLGQKLAGRKRLLSTGFGLIVIAVGAYVTLAAA